MQFKSMQMAFKPCALRAKNDFRYGITLHIQSAKVACPKPVMACVLPLLFRRRLMWKQDMKTDGHYHFETINIQNKNQKKRTDPFRYYFEHILHFGKNLFFL